MILTCYNDIIAATDQEPQETRTLLAELHYAPQTITNAISELFKAGYIQPIARGLWTRTDKPYTPVYRTPAPDGAIAAGQALGISRQSAHAGIRAGRIRYENGMWARS